MDKSCWTHILIILLYVWNAFTFTTSYCRKLILTSASLQFLQGRCPRYHLQWCLLLHLILKVSSHSKNYTCVYSTINMIKDKTTKEFVYFTQINNFMISWHDFLTSYKTYYRSLRITDQTGKNSSLRPSWVWLERNMGPYLSRSCRS